MKKKIRFLIGGLVCILVVIAFVVYSNNSYKEKEQELLATIEEGSMEDYCIKWIKEKYDGRNLFIKNIENIKVGGNDTIHGELLLGSKKEYFCIKVKEDNFKSRGGLSQLLVGDEISYNEEGIGTIYK